MSDEPIMSTSWVDTFRVHVSELLSNTKAALSDMPSWERLVHLFWLAGPFILLIERSPADLWLSLLATIFLFRSVCLQSVWWLQTFWVRAAFLFWAVCLAAAAFSTMPIYSVGEAVAWFRFPLFAMAVTFWLGRDRRLVKAMLVSIGLGMLVMGGINIAELVLVGQDGGRLSWPYGDLVPGNYLAKACLPAFVVVLAFATSASNRLANLAALTALFSLSTSVMTGERVNFLIRLCSAVIAAVVWKPRIVKVASVAIFFLLALCLAIISSPSTVFRFVVNFFEQLPFHSDSNYYQTMAPGVLAFLESPTLGVGPGNMRFLCQEITSNSIFYDCHPHPHNYYIQMLGETGIIGLVTGILFLGSIIWACARPALHDRSNVVVATMWIVPFGLFWPIATTADFFGQWNNIFMWSAVGIALAGSQIGNASNPAPND